MKYKVGPKEFGEVYHVAVAATLDDSVKIYCYDYIQAMSFLNEFVLPDGRNAAVSFNSERLDHLSSTANIISNKYYPGCMDAVINRINKRAEEQGWTIPDLFKSVIDCKDDKILIWQRNKNDHATHRNSTNDFISQIAEICNLNNAKAVLVGENSELVGNNGSSIIFVNNFWTDQFYETDSTAKQLWTINQLYLRHSVKASVGMMSGAIDGPAMFYGNKTIFIARQEDATPRMQKIGASIPNLIWLRSEYYNNFTKLSAYDENTLKAILWNK